MSSLFHLTKTYPWLKDPNPGLSRSDPALPTVPRLQSPGKGFKFSVARLCYALWGPVGAEGPPYTVKGHHLQKDLQALFLCVASRTAREDAGEYHVGL